MRKAMPRESVIPVRVVQEEIASVEHQIGFFVRVLVGVGSENERGRFVFDVPQTFDVVEIQDRPEVKGAQGLTTSGAVTDYTDLMSDRPAWAPNKPAGTFRNEDLWPLIDRIRARRA